LRNLQTSTEGINAIANQGVALLLAREMRADQYGIRTYIHSGDTRVKFEIVLEGRIEFDLPGTRDLVGNVTTLTKVDLLAIKLLANSDRWNDSAVYSRDAIDLVMLAPSKAELELAVNKAHQAYGDSIHKDTHKAINALLLRDGRLEECMKILKIEIPKAVLWQKLKDFLVGYSKIYTFDTGRSH
jgi:hypothetical protein